MLFEQFTLFFKPALLKAYVIASAQQCSQFHFNNSRFKLCIRIPKRRGQWVFFPLFFCDLNNKSIETKSTTRESGNIFTLRVYNFRLGLFHNLSIRYLSLLYL